MSTWADLIAEVRAQVDVSDDQALAWLLDRARVLNAETGWLLAETEIAAVDGTGEYLAPDGVRIEAVSVGGIPYNRGTLSQIDYARSTGSRKRLFADAVDESEPDDQLFAINPLASAGTPIVVRYLADVAEPSDLDTSPPFPDDFHQPIADGAIAMGLARMDERFDSAGYFDAKFTDAIARLRKRRANHAGRGATSIRLTRR